MKCSSIKILNFRGISNLEIDSLTNINILLGKNNSGKTTILESIFLLSGMRNSSLIANINFFRGLVISDPDDFRFVFNDLEFSNKPILSCLMNDSRLWQLELIPKFQSTSIRVPQPSPSISSNQPETTLNKNLIKFNGNSDFTIDSLEFKSILKDISSGSIENFSSFVSIERDNNTVNYKTDPERTNAQPASFKTIFQTTVNNFYSDLALRVDKLLQAKGKNELIESLQVIDSRIVDISLSSGSVIYVDIGGSRLVPINLMGDGVIKFLTTIVNIYTARGGILLIDEIENGLHYSNLIKLWKIILKLSKNYNVQIFLTTHNIEVLKYLNEVLEDNEYIQNKNSIKIYTIQNLRDKGHKVYTYDMDSLKFSIENQVEIRGLA